MKKIILCVFFIITSAKTNAAELFDFSWNLGNMGLGINYSANDDDNIELNLSLFNFTLEHKDKLIGFEFIPVKYRHLFKLQNEIESEFDADRFSFFNINMYWDIVENKDILFGPFLSINYLFEDALNGITPYEYILGLGLRFSFKLKKMVNLDKYNNQIFSTEIGYRNINTKSKFYFSVSVDLISGLIGIGQAAMQNNK